MKKQVSDLEKKEMAYSKTIQEADTIMARVELSYQERIAELEQEKHDLKEKLWEVEEKTGAREELLGRLQQVEQAEAALREKVGPLGCGHNPLKQVQIQLCLLVACSSLSLSF